MTCCCDLHTHSCFSDGTDTPAQIAAAADELGLSAVALTDHNTIRGLPEFLEAAKGRAVRAIPGVEISTVYGRTELHIVGLYLRPDTFGALTEFLEYYNLQKEKSNRTLVRNLHRAGYQLDYDEIRAAHPGNINRAVIAAVLMEKGYIAQVRDAFQGLLAPGAGYYIPPERISAFDAISFLRSVHAVPVLAHPFLDLQREELTYFLRQAKPKGLAAMETRYGAYSPETTASAIQVARALNLLESGGSDYHGANKPDIRLGTGRGTLAVPASLAVQLEAWQP